MLAAEREGDVVRVRLQGDLDLYSAPRFERFIERLGDLRGRIVVLDLHELHAIDSSGVAVLVAAKLRGDREDFQIAIDAASDNVRRIFRIMRLDRFFPLASRLTGRTAD